MLTIRETLWQLARFKGRTLILLLASAMLAGCVAFYLSNIQANVEAIDRLAETIPVTVRVSNSRGDREWGLNINAFRHDNFLSSPYLKNFKASIHVVGEYSEEARAQSPFAHEETKHNVGITPYQEGDCTLGAISRLECMWMPDGELTYLEGYDETMFQTDEAVCLVWPDFAKKNGIEVGDEISLPLYTLTYINEPGRDVRYIPLGEQAIKVVGTYASNENPKEFLAPEAWVRRVMEEQGLEVSYNELEADLKDPRQLNAFKDSIEGLQFLETNPEGMDMFTGGYLVVKDEQYVTAVEPLGQTVALFRRFQVPFFALVIGMIVLAIFLIMRGSRRIIAISISLGRPKLLCGLGCFLAAFLAELAGCLLVLPAMLLLAGLSLGGGLMICGAFLLCACLGDALALVLILRFNAFTLLTAVE